MAVQPPNCSVFFAFDVFSGQQHPHPVQVPPPVPTLDGREYLFDHIHERLITLPFLDAPLHGSAPSRVEAVAQPLLATHHTSSPSLLLQGDVKSAGAGAAPNHESLRIKIPPRKYAFPPRMFGRQSAAAPEMPPHLLIDRVLVVNRSDVDLKHSAADNSELDPELMSYTDVLAAYGIHHAQQTVVDETDLKILSQAVHYRRNNDVREVECLKVLDNNPYYQAFLALAFHRVGNYEEAFRTIDSAFQIDPSLYPQYIHHKLYFGYATDNGGYIADVLKAYSDGFRVQGNDMSALVHVCSDISYNLFDLNRSYSNYQNLWNANQTDYFSLFNMGVILYEQCRFEESLGIFLQLQRAVPGFVTAATFIDLLHLKSQAVASFVPIPGGSVPQNLRGIERYPFNKLFLAEKFYAEGHRLEASKMLSTMPGDGLKQIHATLLLEARLTFHSEGMEAAVRHFDYVKARGGDYIMALKCLQSALKHEGANTENLCRLIAGLVEGSALQ